ncbi:hypothetical protein Haur_2715 [Herpetosiphon aurantiacus DSM 785]|uniref:Uncharacterized protein n=1 Tax=Herpetosiphon aurantiacus (strain ATCC 23779 / DSM 785 / 114-95) TaxID=316274 RepID=A9B175_HERA2|nr:hypothetical protein Haur_2715 [Herpetosiphon aurantiacus DSM 785]
MNNRRLALLVSLCAVLLGFAVAKRPEVTSAKALLTPTPTPLRSELILSGPTEVQVGQLFTITIQYVNIGLPYTTITMSPNNLAQFDPPMTMPCKYNEHPTGCQSITLRATTGGMLEIFASATGEVPIAGGGWAWGSAQARNPIWIDVIDPNATATPTPMPTCVPATRTPTSTMLPTYTPTPAGQATATPTPTKTRTPTPTALPCQQTSYAELLLSAPSQVRVGDVFTLTIDYVNIGAPDTGISLSPNGLAQVEAPSVMPCDFFEDPTHCTKIRLRATAVGELTIDAWATGELFIDGGWMWGGARARNPVYVNIVAGDGTPTFTPTPTKTGTPTPTFPSYPCYTPTTRPIQKQAPQVTQAPCTPTPTSTATPTFPSAPCFTPTAQPLNSNRVQTTQVPCTPTPTATKTATPCPTNLAMRGSTCIGTPTITPNRGSPTITPIVSELILSAPPLVNVGDAFSLTIQYVNIGVPYTGITLSPTGTVQFDPPLTMPCKFNEHPTDCRTIGLRAVAPGTITINAGANGEVPISGGGWAWGSAHARNPINVQVRSVLAHKAFIPFVKTQ